MSRHIPPPLVSKPVDAKTARLQIPERAPFLKSGGRLRTTLFVINMPRETAPPVSAIRVAAFLSLSFGLAGVLPAHGIRDDVADTDARNLDKLYELLPSHCGILTPQQAATVLEDIATLWSTKEPVDAAAVGSVRTRAQFIAQMTTSIASRDLLEFLYGTLNAIHNPLVAAAK